MTCIRHEGTKVRSFAKVAAAAVTSWLIPAAALACPVCFGNSDAPMAIATNTGIMAMLVVVAGVLGAFASFFIYLRRQQKMAAAMTESTSSGAGYPRGSRAISEGTAQC